MASVTCLLRKNTLVRIQLFGNIGQIEIYLSIAFKSVKENISISEKPAIVIKYIRCNEED